MADELPPEAVELYALDPGEFTAARNRLVKQLRSDGRRDHATAVASLRRPTPAAWALDQVAREHADLVDAALAAGRALHDATEAVAAGGDHAADDLRTAMEDEQAASAAVVDAAVVHLAERGAALRPKVLSTLRAAVLDDDVADELRRGVLSADHEAAGFGFGFDLAPPAPATRGGTTKTSGRARAARPSSTTRSARGAPARERGSDPRRQADEEKAAAKAAKEARRQEEAARRERRRELRQRVRELRERANDLDREASRAEAEAQRARTRATEAARELEEAQRRLDEV